MYLFLKTIHILSATVLFGTGIGIAFFMWRSSSTKDLAEKYFAVRTTVLADMIFTLPAVILQPISGIGLLWILDLDWRSDWLLVSFGLYVIAGLCWIPVVWIQWRLKQQLSESIRQSIALPESYEQYFRWWFYLGWPAFISLLAIFYLMVAKPI